MDTKPFDGISGRALHLLKSGYESREGGNKSVVEKKWRRGLRIGGKMPKKSAPHHDPLLQWEEEEKEKTPSSNEVGKPQERQIRNDTIAAG